ANYTTPVGLDLLPCTPTSDQNGRQGQALIGHGAGLRCRYSCVDPRTGNLWSAVPSLPPVIFDVRGRAKAPEQRLEDLLAAAKVRDQHERTVHKKVYVIPPEPDFRKAFGGGPRRPRGAWKKK